MAIEASYSRSGFNNKRIKELRGWVAVELTLKIRFDIVWRGVRSYSPENFRILESVC